MNLKKMIKYSALGLVAVLATSGFSSMFIWQISQWEENH